MPIAAGELRRRIVIERSTPTVNAAGETVDSWRPLRTVQAAIKPVSGREYFTANQIRAEVTHRITMRPTDVTPKDRLKYQGRLFNIVSIIDEDEAGHTYTVMATERN